MKTYCYLLSIMIGLLLIPTETFSQTREISGQITNKNGDPIPNITVKVIDTDKETQTNTNGEYKIEIPASMSNVKFDFPSMQIEKLIVIDDNTINLILTEEEISFLDLSFEELLNIEVSTVSKKSQSISEAPAIITTITQAKIEELGVQKLSELLEYVPGFTVHDTYWKKLNTARGVAMTMYNDKVLMLINGIPTYDACNMEYYLDLIPIVSIKQVEIIRGPGSTLYGTNAFSAVINVITKNGDNDNKVEAYIGGGSFATKNVGVSINDKTGEFSYHFGATMKDDDGYIKEDFVDETGVIGDNVYEDDLTNLFGNIKYKDFSLNTGYMYNRRTIFGPMPRFMFANNNNLGTGGRRNDEKLFLNLIYDKEISEKLNTKITFHYDYTDKQTDLGRTGEVIYQGMLGLVDTTIAPDYYRMTGWLFQTEAQVGYYINDKISLLGGISYEKRITENLADLFSDLNGDRLFSGSTLEDGDVNTNIEISDIGTYLQVDGRFGKLGYVAGIRGTYLGISEKMNITPRFGLVYNFSESSSVKALYGEAFRGAGPQEQYYKVPTIIYGLDAIDQGLDPERIKTYELALDQTILKRYKLRINGFILNIFDIMARREATATELPIIDPGITATKIYDNMGEQKIQGGEVEISGYPTNDINFFINFSYKDGKRFDEDGNETHDYIEYIENLTSSGGVSFIFGKFTISPNYTYIGEREGTLTSDPNTFVSVDAYTLLNLTADYKFTDQFKISLSARNILDEEYLYPETSRRNMLTIPGGSGRALYCRLGFKF